MPVDESQIIALLNEGKVLVYRNDEFEFLASSYVAPPSFPCDGKYKVSIRVLWASQPGVGEVFQTEKEMLREMRRRAELGEWAVLQP